MKLLLSFLAVLCLAGSAAAQRHLFIITIDGFRWQEVFNGADPLLTRNEEYVRDTALTRQLYGDSTAELRRRRLMPFFWTVIAEKGQLYGNRSFNNKVNVKNFYKISYPGYNEIFTGHTDAFISPNLAINNKNVNVLEYLNASAEYHDKVAVFTSWNVFPFILNEGRSHLPVNSGYKKDLLTYLTAREYVERHHPSVLFLGFGETDEFAHAGRYDLYLQQAGNIDRMIADLWYAVQTDPYYKDSTTFLITTDHGRGWKTNKWTTHGFWANGSGDIWLAMLGPGILPEGELKDRGQVYQRQFAATMAALLEDPVAPGHPPGTAIRLATIPAIPLAAAGVAGKSPLTGTGSGRLSAER